MTVQPESTPWIEEPEARVPDAAAAERFGRQYIGVKRVVFVVNTDRFFLTHRASWAIAMTAAGSRVTVIAADTGYAAEIRRLGISFVPLAVGREDIGVRDAARVASVLLVRLVMIRPKLVFLVATTAYTLGWPSALLLWRTRFVRVITGAGRALGPLASRKAAHAVRSQVAFGSALPNVFTLFQLESDRDYFAEARLARRSRSTVVPGTGIDVETWTPPVAGDNGPKHPVRFLFASRLIREKGVYAYVEAARSMASMDARFMIAGAPDRGVRTSVTDDDIARWNESGVIEYLGHQDSMLEVYRRADVLVLPTQYPEGTPRVLIEAAASGLAIIASDQLGCRAVVRDEEEGLIVSSCDAGALAEAMIRVASDGVLRARLAAAARRRIVEEFSVESVLARVFSFSGVYKRPAEFAVSQ